MSPSSGSSPKAWPAADPQVQRKTVQRIRAAFDQKSCPLFSNSSLFHLGSLYPLALTQVDFLPIGTTISAIQTCKGILE